MAGEKTIPVSFRVSPRFKVLLEVAAAREHRSMTNMLESLLFEYCEQHGFDDSSPKMETAPAKGASK